MTLSLDASSNSGTEDLIGVALKDLPRPAPPGLRILNITTDVMPEMDANATFRSSTSPDSLIAFGEVGMAIQPS